MPNRLCIIELLSLLKSELFCTESNWISIGLCDLLRSTPLQPTEGKGKKPQNLLRPLYGPSEIFIAKL